MAWRKKLTPAKLVDFLDAALDDANASKAGLVALAGGAGSPPPAPPTPPADGAPAPAVIDGATVYDDAYRAGVAVERAKRGGWHQG